MNTILLVLTMCYPNQGCESFLMDTFPADTSECEEVIIQSGQKGAWPLRCEVLEGKP